MDGSTKNKGGVRRNNTVRLAQNIPAICRIHPEPCRASMTFDEKFKERAQANDAVDRLRELKERLQEDQVRRERQCDLALRLGLTGLIILVVGYALVR